MYACMHTYTYICRLCTSVLNKIYLTAYVAKATFRNSSWLSVEVELGLLARRAGTAEFRVSILARASNKKRDLDGTLVLQIAAWLVPNRKAVCMRHVLAPLTARLDGTIRFHLDGTLLEC